MTILQVPIKKEIRDKALLEARRMGFDSLQSLVRFFLQKTVDGKVDIKIFIRE